jgi:porphobilinogen synthase
MDIRSRRLRGDEALRRLTRETRVSADSLIYPLFIREGKGVKEGITSMPGQFRYSPDTVARAVEDALQEGVRSFLLFGIPESKDESGTTAYDDNGAVQQALRSVRSAFGNDAYLITDVCLCEYTSHGHCGLLKDGNVENDSTLPLLAKAALSHVRAGSDMVAPSGMMDGTVAALRSALDADGFEHIPIMNYSVKYASSFYGPFRDAAGSAPQSGDRKSYQMDYHNVREALKVIRRDIIDGTDIIIVKPALAYLDVISKTRDLIRVPIAAYSVSGEYSMIKAAAASGFIDEYGVMCESAVSIFRAGADTLITYFAKELASAIRKGDIG